MAASRPVDWRHFAEVNSRSIGGGHVCSTAPPSLAGAAAGVALSPRRRRGISGLIQDPRSVSDLAGHGVSDRLLPTGRAGFILTVWRHVMVDSYQSQMTTWWDLLNVIFMWGKRDFIVFLFHSASERSERLWLGFFAPVFSVGELDRNLQNSPDGVGIFTV